MIAPTWDIAYTTDDASDSTPSWTTVANSNVRSVTVSRGREDELGRVEAGTATLVLNNRTNLFNPQIVTGLRPMNRWRLRATYNAVTYDVFLGYAESYEQQWPATGEDAVTVVRLVDEFKVLALDRLPAMQPPTAQTYADVVKFAEPQGYWRLQETAASGDVIFKPEVGSVNMTYDTNVGRTATPIVGDYEAEVIAGTAYGARNTTYRFITIEGEDGATPGLPVGGPGDAGGMSQMSFELWFKSSETTPAANRTIAYGPLSGGNPQWGLYHDTSGSVRAFVYTPTLSQTAVATSLTANTWYHLAITYDNSFVRLYVNGVQDAANAATGQFGAMDAGAYLQIGHAGGPGGLRYFDELAYYRYSLTSNTLPTHYEAGVNRGFPAQDPGARITAVLAASTSVAASSIRAGSRQMIPVFMTGQAPLTELRKAEAADSVDSMLYIAANGTVTFLDDGHRSSSPWNTVQATFDDDGTDLPYRECSVDYSETFLYNTINVTRTGGITSTSTDATSVSRYRERPLPLTDLPITTDSDQSAIATALLAKYKDPMTRVTSITVDLKTAALIAATLDLELADRIRILRTPVGGGTRIDQTSFVQSIQLTASPDRPWQLRFGVSPL